MKKIIYRPKHEFETLYKKDWDDIVTTILVWICAILMPITIITVVVLKIKKEIGFWKWIFQGMPDVSNHRWYALSVVCTIGICVLCVVLAVIDAMSEKIRKYKRTIEDKNEEKR